MKKKNLWRLRYLDTPVLKAENVKILDVSDGRILMENGSHCHSIFNIATRDFSTLPRDRVWLAGDLFCENGVYVNPEGDPYLLSGKTICVPRHLKFCPNFSEDLCIIPDASGQMLLLKEDLSAESLDVKIDIESATDYTPVKRVEAGKESQESIDTVESRPIHWVYVRERSGRLRFYDYSSGKLKLAKTFELSRKSSPLLAVKPYENLTLEYSRTKGLRANIESKTKPIVLAPPESQVQKLLVTEDSIEVTYQSTDGIVHECSIENIPGRCSKFRRERRNIFFAVGMGPPLRDELSMDEIYDGSVSGAFYRAILAALSPQERKIFMQFATQMRTKPAPRPYRRQKASIWGAAQRLTPHNQRSVWECFHYYWVLFYNCLYLANWNLEDAFGAVTRFMQQPAVSLGEYAESELFVEAAKESIWDMPDIPQNWL